MFEFRLYLYDLNFNDLNESIDLFPALLNEDISLTIERERGVFEKTNSDLSLSFSNFVKLSNGLTIFKYLKDNIASKKFRIKVSKNSIIVFDGYVENESISYDVENETLELNVFAIEKEFWKRCEQIKFSEINPFMNDGETSRSETLDTIFSSIKSNINTKQYFKDIFNDLVLSIEPIIKNRQIVIRDNTLKTGFYWLDRDKFSLKEFFEAIFKIYNLEFKIDYDTKIGTLQTRLKITGTTIDVSKDIIKDGFTFSPQIEKFDLIKVNDIADINNEELFEIDTTATVDDDIYRISPSFFYVTTDTEAYVSVKKIHDMSETLFPHFTIPIIRDIGGVTSRMFRNSAHRPEVEHRGITIPESYIVVEVKILNNDTAVRMEGSYSNRQYFTTLYFGGGLAGKEARDNYMFNGFITYSNIGSYLDKNLVNITDETQIRRSSVFELENEVKLSFHEDKNGDNELNIDEDKPKEATRNQIQSMFNLGGVFYQTLIENYKPLLTSTSKIECDVNRNDLRIGDKLKVKTENVDGDFIVLKNEIDLVNGISKIEALSEVI